MDVNAGGWDVDVDVGVAGHPGALRPWMYLTVARNARRGNTPKALLPTRYATTRARGYTRLRLRRSSGELICTNRPVSSFRSRINSSQSNSSVCLDGSCMPVPSATGRAAVAVVVVVMVMIPPEGVRWVAVAVCVAVLVSGI